MHKDLEQLGASVIKLDVDDGKDAIDEFYANKKTGFKHVHDPGGTLAQKLGIYYIPTMLVFDRFGFERFSGSLKAVELKTLVKKLAAETRPAPTSSSKDFLLPGDNAPDFSGVTLDGKAFDLKKTTESFEHVAIFFSSHSCPSTGPAIEQFGEIARLGSGSGKIRFLVVNIEGDIPKVKEFAESLDHEFTIIADNFGITKKYGIEGAPFGVVVDKAGKIESYGHFNAATLMDVLEKDFGMESYSTLDKTFSFKAKTRSNREIDLLKFARGKKAVLLSFQNADNDLTHDDIEDFSEYAETLKGKGVGIITVDMSEDFDMAAEYYDENAVPGEVIFDESKTAAETADVDEGPMVYLITPQGKIAYSGQVYPAAMDHCLSRILEKKPLTPYIDKSPTFG